MKGLLNNEEAVDVLENLIGTERNRIHQIYNLGYKEGYKSAEPKVGRWIYESCSRLIDETDEGRVYTIEKRWHCSECGYEWGDEDYNFCPNCGAKMGGNNDE